MAAISSTRLGGYSSAPYSSFNLALHTGDQAGLVLKNREQLQRELLLENIQWLNQVHGCAVVETDKTRSKETVTADAAWTTDPGVAIAIMTADCLPVLIADKNSKLVAGAHCGWKGLQTGLLAHLFERMPCAADDLVVWLGPAIGQQNYAVAASLVQKFPADLVADPTCFLRSEKAWHHYLSLTGIARRQLNKLGVSEIHSADICVYEDARFFSYRREKVTGRMVSLIWIK